jgi:hypothetical protein
LENPVLRQASAGVGIGFVAQNPIAQGMERRSQFIKQRLLRERRASGFVGGGNLEQEEEIHPQFWEPTALSLSQLHFSGPDSTRLREAPSWSRVARWGRLVSRSRSRPARNGPGKFPSAAEKGDANEQRSDHFSRRITVWIAIRGKRKSTFRTRENPALIQVAGCASQRCVETGRR